MNPIGKPATATVYMENSREHFREGDVELASERSRRRANITGYPNPLTDILIKNIAMAKKITAAESINLRGSGLIVDDSA